MSNKARRLNVYKEKLEHLQEHREEPAMTKEKAIMELVSNAEQMEALDCCIKILDGWEKLEDLIEPIRVRKKEIEERNNQLYDLAVGGKFDDDKAF